MRERALALGAADLRVADASGDELTERRMKASFARGDHATWGYDERYANGAAHPETLLPRARRVVCVAVPYRTPAPRARRRLTGVVSTYAWSRDYHRRIKALLGELATMLDDAAGEPATRIACDTAPLAERAFAAAAGVGWVGKHTNLISPHAGSFIFLGEIVTTVALPVDGPLKKQCGSCTRCVTACPTGALRGDYTIDATLCIADLNQRTDQIPRVLRALIGDWVWGCDLCAVACPPNARAAVAGDPAFAPVDGELAHPDLIALLHLKSGDYKRRYRTTAMGWRGAAVLRRNAAIVLGNALDRAAVPALCAALREDPHPVVRGAAAWALGRIGSPPARQALRDAAPVEAYPSVREEISQALAAPAGTVLRDEPLNDV